MMSVIGKRPYWRCRLQERTLEQSSLGYQGTRKNMGETMKNV